MTSWCGVDTSTGATMDAGPPRPAREEVVVQTSTKAMTCCTVGSLVTVTAYTVALGASGWLWFAWVVLGLCTIGVLAIRQ